MDDLIKAGADVNMVCSAKTRHANDCTASYDSEGPTNEDGTPYMRIIKDPYNDP